MANAPEVARAVVTITPVMEGAQKEIATQLGAVSDDAGSKAGKKAGSSFTSFMGSAIKAGIGTIGSAVTAVTTAATTVVGTTVAASKTLVDSAKAVSEYGDEIDKTSQKLGLSKQAYQEWDYVMHLAGTEMSSMSTGLKTLTNKLDDAKNGSEDAQAMFDKLGISMDDISSMSREELFAKTIAGFQGMADSTERAALANDLFGKSGQNLTPLFNQSAEATQELIKEAHEYGMIMSDDAVNASAVFQDSLTKMENTIAGVKNSMIGDLLPSLTMVTDGLAKVFKGDMSGADMMAEGIKSIIEGLTNAIPTIISTMTTIITTVAQMLPELLTVLVTAIIDVMPQLTDGILGVLPTLLEAVYRLLTEVSTNLGNLISPIIDALPTLILQIATAIATYWPQIYAGIVQLMDQVVDHMPEINDKFVAILPELIQLIVKGLTDTLPILIEGFTLLFIGLAAAIPQMSVALLDAAPEITKALITGVTTSWPQFETGMKELFDRIKDTIEEACTSYADKMKIGATKLGTVFLNQMRIIVPKVAAVLNQILAKIGVWANNLITKGRLAATKFNEIVHQTLSLLPPKVVEIGTKIVEGLWNGIENKTEWLKAQIQTFCETALDAIKAFFKIESPSKVMRDEVGTMLAEGMALGITKNMDPIDSALDKVEGLFANRFDYNLALAGDNPSMGLKNNIFNNTITVNGATDPEAWAEGFVRTLNRQARMA